MILRLCRCKRSNTVDEQHLSKIAARIEGINPGELTRQINAIQMQLLDLAIPCVFGAVTDLKPH